VPLEIIVNTRPTPNRTLGLEDLAAGLPGVEAAKELPPTEEGLEQD